MNFVETLHDGQCLFGRIAVLFVRRTLKLGQIVRQRCFFGVLLDSDFFDLADCSFKFRNDFCASSWSLSRKDSFVPSVPFDLTRSTQSDSIFAE